MSASTVTASDAPAAPPPYVVHAMLLGVAALWGAAFPLMQIALRDFAASTAVGLRFFAAAAATLPWAYRDLRQRQAQRYGLLLGLIMLVIYLILAKVLGSMSPPRCAFLMGTTALFVQLPSLLTRRAQRSEVVASVVSVLGVYTLTGLDSQPLGHAEALVLGAAALSALGLVVLRLATQRSAASASALTFYSLLTVGSGAALVMLYESPAWRAASAQAWGALMYCALVAGAFTQWLQATYQKHASDGVAAMIFALKPLFAAIFSALLLGGPLEGRTYMGGSLMLLAALGPPLWAGRLPPK